MEEPEIKYILDQANIEVEHNRSWPTKVMAFYVAINFGLVSALITLRNNSSHFSLHQPTENIIITILLLILAFWVTRVLYKNHRNYLTYRNLQVCLQQKFLVNQKEEFGLPEDWFKRNELCLSTRFLGWGLYFYIVVAVTFPVLSVIWGLKPNGT